ncbi:complexin-like [Uloborus diversus]|uniref:complexin-like n=1 Tax=Uloborus diversus TaxID=327109 RepID=UPI00240A6400|nr:complexin-like [Uloborus diversus]XP_054715213.1 complexin-like [Uloborus diversus]
MAAFVAKQMVGSKLNAVKGAVGTEEEGTTEDKNAEDEEEQERLEALREAEERRKEKHRKMEEEREKMRQEIRDKYGIKKKEEVQQEDPFADMEGSSLNRKRKTPAELAAEAEAEDQDEFTKLKNTLETQVSELKSTIEGKCLLQ